MSEQPRMEPQRLEALRKSNLLYTPAEERFDRITRVAQRMFGVPYACIGLITEDTGWFKSRQGLDVHELPRDAMFCAHTIQGQEALVVEDARQDPRFRDNPAVRSAKGMRFYAGFALRDRDGHALGTLCVLDVQPRAFSATDVRTLCDLARIAQDELQLDHKVDELVHERADLERRALVDPLTGLWNRGAILERLTRDIGRARREGAPCGVIMVDIDHFKAVNDSHGHPAGDRVLAETAQRLRTAVRPSDAVGRYGGEEFLVVLPGCDLQKAAHRAEELRAAVSGLPVPWEKQRFAVTISLGVAVGAGDAAALVGSADEALYRAKHGGRNRVELAQAA